MLSENGGALVFQGVKQAEWVIWKENIYLIRDLFSNMSQWTSEQIIHLQINVLIIVLTLTGDKMQAFSSGHLGKN